MSRRGESALISAVLLLPLLLASCGGGGPSSEGDPSTPAAGSGGGSSAGSTGGVAVERTPNARERRFGTLRQLTFGGENAEAYWSADGARLIFQSTRGPYECDQIFTMSADGTDLTLVSTGRGRTTCAYFLPGDRILYSSTHLEAEPCPPPPDRAEGYTWALYRGYDLFTARSDGTDLIRLTDVPGYDAEATLSPDGNTIVFTSDRSGDLDIYTMNVDGSGLRRLTESPGYDGGPFFSADGSKIVYRAFHPGSRKELDDYRRLLRKGLIRPSRLEIYVMNADGTRETQVTDLGGANFAPFFHPDGRRIIFSSNHADPRGREFDLYLVNIDGSGLERVTFTPEFDGFPMFSPDGTRLAFASNRHNDVEGETNIFVADWVEDPAR